MQVCNQNSQPSRFNHYHFNQRGLWFVIKSDLGSSLAQALTIAVMLDNMHTTLCALARSPSGILLVTDNGYQSWIL